ncbi:hypothetical protein [Bradyrhizobium sp.]|uniref:hypothetical protein n=1 Tax=Bradyrhizobium sp. TaxID=376 RepID=UPI001D98759F|nr:hypothetical protein [Bradyrhizobium sp.]MBV8698455.1 hypothetical protein [Bradyrhizobium sp.]MBV8917478.1 hypothetical protein [Bradyrhizobium sp.]MBV9978428.1 hypothetical protein [Bradyrhizobium sp.]
MVNGDITVHDRLTHGDALDARESAPHQPQSRRARRMCPAMAQQRTDVGNEAAPQKFIRLTGCRDPRRAGSAATLSPTLASRG